MLKLATPILLEPTCQTYHWGKRGSNSLVARLLGTFDDDKTYAELWVGEHPRSPATAIVEETVRNRTLRMSLRDLISRYPKQVLGEKVLREFGPDLPFLFKVLSIDKPLSIQAHPNRELARQLYKLDSSSYPDANHKPELAIALSQVNFLYGFKDRQKLSETLAREPELASIVGDEVEKGVDRASPSRLSPEGLKQVYTKIVKCNSETYQKKCHELVDRLRKLPQLRDDEKLALQIFEDYGPSDLGIFSVFLLNFCTLNPGEAIFVKPNVLHAYLSGELAECMANSDNVLRAGITPKKQDVDKLIEMLDFSEQHPPTVIRAVKGKSCPEAASYVTAAEEFCCDIIEADALDLRFATGSSPTLIFCLEGSLEIVANSERLLINQGKAVFIPALLDEFSLSLHGGKAIMVNVP